jgi:hypothetical protein
MWQNLKPETLNRSALGGELSEAKLKTTLIFYS